MVERQIEVTEAGQVIEGVRRNSADPVVIQLQGQQVWHCL